MEKTSIVDSLIENINSDQRLLDTIQEKIDLAKQEKRDVTSRLKDYRKDISTFVKYADEKQRKKIEELGFDFSESEQGLNAVAKLAYDLLIKAKDHRMTNEDLYKAYVATFKNKNDAYNYTEFNIKCRSLFNTQRLLRTKSKDSKSSREDIISINGKVIDTQEPKTANK